MTKDRGAHPIGWHESEDYGSFHNDYDDDYDYDYDGGDYDYDI